MALSSADEDSLGQVRTSGAPPSCLDPHIVHHGLPSSLEPRTLQLRCTPRNGDGVRAWKAPPAPELGSSPPRVGRPQITPGDRPDQEVLILFDPHGVFRDGSGQAECHQPTNGPFSQDPAGNPVTKSHELF